MMDRLKKLLIISLVHASLIGLIVDQARTAGAFSDNDLQGRPRNQNQQLRFAQVGPSDSSSAERRSFFNGQTVGGWLVVAGLPVVLIGAGWYAVRRTPRPCIADASDFNVESLPPDAPLLEATKNTESDFNVESSPSDVPLLETAKNTEFEKLELQLAEFASSGHPATVDLAQPPVSSTTRLAKVDIVESLIADLQHPDRAKRCQAIWELGQRGDSRAVQPLVDTLVEADSQQRGLILAAVAEISTRTLKPVHRALILSLQDESADVRKNAIRDVTRIYDSMAQVRQLLQYAADDADLEVQETAQWALNQLNRSRPLPEMESVHAIEKSLDSQHPGE